MSKYIDNNLNKKFIGYVLKKEFNDNYKTLGDGKDLMIANVRNGFLYVEYLDSRIFQTTTIYPNDHKILMEFVNDTPIIEPISGMKVRPRIHSGSYHIRDPSIILNHKDEEEITIGYYVTSNLFMAGFRIHNEIIDKLLLCPSSS